MEIKKIVFCIFNVENIIKQFYFEIVPTIILVKFNFIIDKYLIQISSSILITCSFYFNNQTIT